jgi:hypothetical protein
VILSEARANAWKFTSAALLVLAVAALLSALYFRGSAALSDASAKAAEADRDYARSERDALLSARNRDDKASAAGETARAQVDAHTATSNERLTQIEVRYRDRTIQVPAVCPAPDPDLVRDLGQQAARLSAAEGRLRAVRPASQTPAGIAKPR